MSEFPPLDNGHAALRFAYETRDLALDNFNNIFPWRWHRFWKQNRLIRRRLKHSKVERARRMKTPPWRRQA